MSTLEDQLRSTLSTRAGAVTQSMLTRSLPEVEAVLDQDAAPVVLLPARRLPHRPHRSGRLVAVALAVAAVLLVAFGAVALHRATSTDRLSPAHLRPRSAIPWDQVGPGWTLEVVVPGTNFNGTNTLYLVDPAAQQWYRICTIDGANTINTYFGSPKSIWTAGLAYIMQDRASADTILTIDLHTGRQRRLDVTGRWASVQPLDPAGNLLLLTNPWTATEKVSSTGHVLVRFPSKDRFGALASPDGTRVALATDSTVEIYDAATGTRLRSMPAPTGYHACIPDYWSAEDAGVVAECEPPGKIELSARFAFSLGSSQPPVPVALPPGWPELYFDGLKDAGPTIQAGSAPDDPPAAKPITIAVPARLQHGNWELDTMADDGFVVRAVTRDGEVRNSWLRWQPLTGQLTDLAAYRPAGSTVVAVDQWQQPGR